jgi:hypothetical protein
VKICSMPMMTRISTTQCLPAQPCTAAITFNDQVIIILAHCNFRMVSSNRCFLWNTITLVAVLLLLLSVAVVAEEAPPEAATEGTDTEQSSTGASAAPVIVASMELTLRTNSGEIAPEAEDDQDERCPEWANSGECQANPNYMLSNCAASCQRVSGEFITATAMVYEGEDAAVGAFRFAEEYLADNANINVLDQQAQMMDTILDVARQLQTKLIDASNYTPPAELTNCGKRPCSAGKLWKRADELRKADMHDAAGAGLIRALLKSGLEIDFVQKCHKSLLWAMGSVQRQRQREQREAIEEAKVEKRREEERKALEEAIVSLFYSRD